MLKTFKLTLCTLEGEFRKRFNGFFRTDYMDLMIERLGVNGEGIAKLREDSTAQNGGYTVFVDGALPGEEVLAEWVVKKKSYGIAKPISWKKRSPDRVLPPCPLFGTCGGCHLMHLSYPKQLLSKRERVVDALERIGKWKEAVVEECRPSPHPLGYRNKIQMPAKDGALGLYQKGSHHFIPVEECYIHSPLGESMIVTLKTLLSTALFKEWIRYVIVKTVQFQNTGLIILVTDPSKEGYSTSFLRTVAERLATLHPEVLGVLENQNQAVGNVILSPEFHLLYGQDFLEEKIFDLKIKVSAPSFFQVNEEQAKQLYQTVLEEVRKDRAQRILDLYSGVGLLSLLLAKEGAEVIGVELASSSIRDAQENSQINGVHSVRFVSGAVEDLLPQLPSAEIVIINPPRRGCESRVIESLIEKKPKKILYISCDPATLARDAHLLSLGGYEPIRAIPFDMFPQTAHVETLLIMQIRDRDLSPQ